MTRSSSGRAIRSIAGAAPGGRGQKVAIIERKLFGGTCVNTGCTPTKTLVANAYAAYLVRRAGDYGITIGGPVGVDMKAVKARKDKVVGASRDSVERSLKTLEGCTVYEGHGRFVGDKKVAVGDVKLAANRVFINVGGRALIPPIPGLDHVRCFTNSSIMDLDIVPPHLIILGGSYIGLEFAQIFRRFGSAVTVIELAPRLIAREDEDVSRAMAEILKDEASTCATTQSRRCRGAGQGHRDQARIGRTDFAHCWGPNTTVTVVATAHGDAKPGWSSVWPAGRIANAHSDKCVPTMRSGNI